MRRIFILTAIINYFLININAQEIKGVKIFLTDSIAQTMATGRITGNFTSGIVQETKLLTPKIDFCFVIACFSVWSDKDVSIDNSDVYLKGCDEFFYSRTPTISLENIDELKIPLEEIQLEDMGPFGIENRPPTEREKQYDVGSSSIIKKDDARTLRYLFNVPINCLYESKINFLDNEYSIPESKIPKIKEVNPKLISDSYERLKWEISASHILIKLDKNANSIDTLNAYNRMMDIRKKIISGEDFEVVAKNYSEDKSAKLNNGFIGYFSAFKLEYPFEIIAYNTKVGEVSQPIRTDFGYHLIKINKKIPNRGEIKVAQIMKKVPKDATNSIKDSIKHEIFEIYNLLQSGEDFNEIAKKYSDDNTSGEKGGELPWFKSTDNLITPFIDNCFAIKNIGDISVPFETKYGWHIVKKNDYKPIGTFEELKPFIIEQLKQTPNLDIY